MSHTTRKPHQEETNGKDYHFVSIEEFEILIKMVSSPSLSYQYHLKVNKLKTSSKTVIQVSTIRYFTHFNRFLLCPPPRLGGDVLFLVLSLSAWSSASLMSSLSSSDSLEHENFLIIWNFTFKLKPCLGHIKARQVQNLVTLAIQVQINLETTKIFILIFKHSTVLYITFRLVLFIDHLNILQSFANWSP